MQGELDLHWTHEASAYPHEIHKEQNTENKYEQ